MEKHMKVPMTKKEAAGLKSGDYVYLTGTIYTARDAAHKRMDEALDRGEDLPLDIKIRSSTTWAPPRQGKAVLSDQRAPQQPAEWTDIRPGFLTWDWEP